MVLSLSANEPGACNMKTWRGAPLVDPDITCLHSPVGRPYRPRPTVGGRRLYRNVSRGVYCQVYRNEPNWKQEAQLPQRNSASAAHVCLRASDSFSTMALYKFIYLLTYLLRLHNLSCNVQDTAESKRLYYFLTFKRSDSRCADRKWILTWNSHSRSFILQSVTGRQGVAYRHIILLAVSLKFSKT